MSRQKTLPENERMAVAAEVVELLSQVDEMGRRRWTTVALGEACGGLRHETIRLARSSAGVGPSVRDGILQLTGQTMEQLLQKHRMEAGAPSRSRPMGYAALTPPPTFMVATPSPSQSGALAVPDRVVLGRQVIAALQADGFGRVDAQGAVSDILFNEDVTDILELYRKARAVLERKAEPSQPQAKSAAALAPSKEPKHVVKKR